MAVCGRDARLRYCWQLPRVLTQVHVRQGVRVGHLQGCIECTLHLRYIRSSPNDTNTTEVFMKLPPDPAAYTMELWC